MGFLSVIGDIIIQALTAVDIDAGAAITYALVGGDDAPPNSKFYLAGNIIKTSAFLDYEDPVVIGRNYQYDLIVTATDVGSPSVATATVRVKVTNRNEYSPEFTVTSGTFDFDEGESIGSSVVPSLLATDLDNGVDGAITFSITGTTPAAGCDFTIFPDTGEIITLGEFDYEAGPTSCTLVIQAVDNGDTPKTASPSYTATININNINDNEPFFTPTTLALAAISENHDTVTAIASISELAAGGDFMVDDLDTVLPDSTYWFASGNDLGLFTFDGLDIKLTQTIDLDNPVFNPSEYTLVIGVSDGDVPPLTGYATLIVEVTPENNHNPFIDHIDPGGTIQINENDPIGTLCATVYAEDRDVDDILAYAIFDGNVNNYFEIDSSTGEIRVANQVDYEAIAPNVNIDLRVTVTDLGGGMVTASVPLLIHNLNDFDPTCTTTSFLELISETDPAGTTIAQLDCSDLDPDTTLTYTIVPSTPDFTVDATGLVTVATGNSIDYDLQSVYNFNVEVTDDEGGLEICNIIVQIQPENTDTPEFIPAFWSIGPIPEDTDPSTSITQVSATDTDSYPLGVQLYEIITVLGSTGTDVTSDVIFDIDPSDGTIYIAAPLDYETETYYEVEIRATDGGGETGIGVLTIDIGNEDDNYPLCAFDSLIRSVPETTATSSIIVSATDLSCTDADGDTLSYTLTPSSPFSVDSSGYITLTGSLDYETANAYGLNLRVSDGGGLYTDIPIYVDVINENDSPPVFASSTYPVTIPEDTAAGIDVILVTAQNFDDPTTPEGQITYSIISGDPDGKFSIDANSGQIKCLGQLDRETEASYSLVIEASDSLSVDTTTVVVTVSDVNDEDPQCTETSFSIEVEETPNKWL
ncbi:cadherin-23-like [Saccoglossus kowalevskii]